MDDEDNASTRRDLFKTILGGAAITGLVANKIAIRGPEPYQPPISSLEGKLIVITGGNTGLGLESAKRLAIAGSSIIITSRTIEKGERAVQDIKDYCALNGVNNNNIYSLSLDLCDLQNVKNFPASFKKSPVGNQTIDVLINNAGVMAIPELELTKDGYEKTFQTNHLGHFALTALLLPILNPNGSKIINVSSSAYMIASKGLDFDNLNGEKEYGPWTSYGQSKLQNILFTKELQRRANNAKINLTTASLHPGAVRTDLARYLLANQSSSSTPDNDSKFQPASLLLLPLTYFTKSVERGATTQIWLASDQGENIGGKFFINKKDSKLSSFAEDVNQAKDLWEVSEKLSGVKFDL